MNTWLQWSRRSRQRGAALIISLVILVIVTLIGTSAMRSVTLEEKVVGNFRDFDLAFQAAESALREGEEKFRLPFSERPPPIQKDQEDLSWIWNNSDAPWWSPGKDPWWVEKPEFWKDKSKGRFYELSRASLSGVVRSPLYIVEYQGSVKDHIGWKNYGDSGKEKVVYRITAQAKGGSHEAVVILQSSFVWPNFFP